MDELSRNELIANAQAMHHAIKQIENMKKLSKYFLEMSDFFEIFKNNLLLPNLQELQKKLEEIDTKDGYLILKAANDI